MTETREFSGRRAMRHSERGTAISILIDTTDEAN